MDNTIASTHALDAQPLMPHETAVHEEHEHVYVPQHRHHFETEEQQREAGSFGMWLFLLTEIMFFGGLFFAYLLFRNWYYPAFAVASVFLIVYSRPAIPTAVGRVIVSAPPDALAAMILSVAVRV